jgi:anti-sigma regulatory factor (Ser/Thr protein kinase)
MLLLSSEIRRFVRTYPEATIACSNYRHMTYAGHMGFFRAFGLEFGKAPGEAAGSPRYLPVTIFDCGELERSAAQKGNAVGDEVEEQSGRMAAMLCGDDRGPAHEALTYSVREIMRNVVEHSGAPRFGVCAQYWPKKHRVEVAILDRGMGLRQSLSNNPHVDASDDKRAINYALMPAVSGKVFKGSRVRQRGHWTNSGFGLYMTSRMCRHGGNFFVASGDSGMLLSKTGGKRYFSARLPGTAVRMVMQTDAFPNLREALASYKTDGFEIQKRYQEIVNIDPSAASMMLSNDFDLSFWDKMYRRIKGGT